MLPNWCGRGAPRLSKRWQSATRRRSGMPSFSYRARSSRGALMQGSMDGADSGAVAAYLVNIGAIPIDIRPEKARGNGGKLWEKLTDVPITTIDVQLFCR